MIIIPFWEGMSWASFTFYPDYPLMLEMFYFEVTSIIVRMYKYHYLIWYWYIDIGWEISYHHALE